MKAFEVGRDVATLVRAGIEVCYDELFSTTLESTKVTGPSFRLSSKDFLFAE